MSYAWRRGKQIRVGSERWVVSWETARAGHGGNHPECEDHFLEDCYDAHYRAFPSKGIAMAFARRKAMDGTPLFFGVLGLTRERFESYEADTAVGDWEFIGQREELDAAVLATGGAA